MDFSYNTKVYQFYNILFYNYKNIYVCLLNTGIFKMPPKRLLSHYKVDSSRSRLLTVSCNAEDMLLPRSNFTFTGK